MSELFSMIEEDKKKRREAANKAEAERVNVIVNKLYAWMEEEQITVKDARVIFRGMTESLEGSMSAKTRPLIEEENKKTLKEFYAEAVK